MVAFGSCSRSARANGADGSIATTSMPSRNDWLCRASQLRTEVPDRPGWSGWHPAGMGRVEIDEAGHPRV